MGLFKNKAGGRQPRPRGDSMDVFVKCEKCGELIKTHIVKGYELIPTYADQGPSYTLNKELIGAKCPNSVQLHMEFDGAKRVVSQSVEGGEFQETREL
jgi:hypothetical protein